MQAAGLLKEKQTQTQNVQNSKAKPHRPMAKPILVASITQENSDTATLIEEAKDGMSWIISNVKVR